MKVIVKYMTQAKQAAGASSEVVDLPGACTVAELVARLVEWHGESLRYLLLNADGYVQPALLLFIGDEQASPQTVLTDGDVVTILAPMAGG
jgi:molybdopterin converting factor small subunit